VAETVAVALPDDACLDEGAAPHGGDGVGVVVTQVEVAGEPEADVGVPLHDLHEPVCRAGVVQPSAPAEP
jgi:hypothetical protein